MFVDQLKNARAALLDVALERSHWRRLVCARALGKMQQKAIKRIKIYWETRSPGALSSK
jgi:transcriptional regulator with AAA-type ATPase domain